MEEFEKSKGELELATLQLKENFLKEELDLYNDLIKDNKRNTCILGFIGMSVLVFQGITLKTPINFFGVLGVCLIVITLNNVVKDYLHNKHEYNKKISKTELDIAFIRIEIQTLKKAMGLGLDE